ncbi:MAG: hypothetical protein A2V88_00575 [Elusimicrobia bacterium RBG_16_66_12]|nr:MAG: hypothetical protein A2V88_00575 [Elusimicrobia bacterium RBG_16_66_12]
MQADSGEDAITGINITPLVDVVLVVLIIFMATAPMIARRAIKVEVPRTAKSDKAATEALAITLDAARRLTIGGRAVDLPELKRLLSAAVASRPDQAVSLSADKTLPYGEVAELLDAVRGAGVRQVGLEVRRK